MVVTQYIKGAMLVCIIALSAGIQAQEATEATDSAEAPPPDVIMLKNGSKIVGTISSARDGLVVVETDFAGTLSIDAETVESIESQGSLVVQLADGTIIRDQPMTVADSQFLIITETGEERAYPATDIALVNPEPWELGDGYKAFGLINFAWALERGNTVTDELDYKLEAYWRSLEDRYTILFNGEVDEANGLKSADNSRIEGKYDYFLGDNNYWGGRIAAETDEFQDLDLRALIGPYYGRQFYEEPILTLAGDLGLSYVTEDFITAEDQEYTGANWEARFSSNYLGGDSNLYINHTGLWNLKDTDDIILNTTFGLAFPLLGNLQAAAEILLEYDSGAVEGIEELDETYRLSIGYTW
ncbi:MAG: DUF481 domain-containing protein [Halioglobus sp.]